MHAGGQEKEDVLVVDDLLHDFEFPAIKTILTPLLFVSLFVLDFYFIAMQFEG